MVEVNVGSIFLCLQGNQNYACILQMKAVMVCTQCTHRDLAQERATIAVRFALP